MFKRIRAKLILLTVGSTLVSILLISFLTNITIFQRYNRYLEQEQSRAHQEIVNLAISSYVLNDGWRPEVSTFIDYSSIIHNYDIEIRDIEGKLVYSHKLETTMIAVHNDMMKQMGHSMMGRYTTSEGLKNEGNYISRSYELALNEVQIGSIEIGSIGPYSVTQGDIEFTKGINRSIIFATIISIVVALLIGIYSSKVFSNPIVKLTKAANDMRNGILDVEVSLKDNTTELQGLADSINHLAKGLSQQQLLRSRLTADISHELRTPLTILQSHIEALNDGIWEPTPDKLSILGKEVNRLIKLVGELKYLADIENHHLKLELSKINLSKLLQEVYEGFSYEFHIKDIVLQSSIEENVIYDGDEDKLKQVFINLMANALKYTNSGGIVRLGLNTDKNNVYISIKDTGIGIDENAIPNIFERFYRSDASRNRKTGGAGIGLTIVKTIVEAHDGRISVESKIAEGSNFIVILPKINKSK